MTTLYENTKYSIVAETHVENDDAFMIQKKLQEQY